MSTVISPAHRVISPSLPELRSNNFEFEMGFIGQPDPKFSINNPGSPSPGGDPDYADKLRGIFGTDREIWYPIGDHGGAIVILSGRLQQGDFSASLRVVPAIGRSGVVVPHTDAVVIHYEAVPKDILEVLTIVLRTWDCGNLLVHNPKEGIIALVHASIQTMFGYHDKNGGGIIDEIIIGLCGNPRDTFVALGPCISGVVGQHACYEFDHDDADRLFGLIAKGYPSLDDSELRHIKCAESQKDNIAFGEIIVRVLEHCGIPRNQIDTSCNHCTLDANGWYSYRRSLMLQKQRHWMGHEADDKIEEQLSARYGNLAFVSFR